MKRRTRDEHLFEPGPKRILALDGGGIRGALTLGYLERIEDILRERFGGDPDFRLCDYFDLMGGTSTGSIIATALAIGYSVEEIRELYYNLANEVFKKPIWRLGLYSSKFPIEPLVALLKEILGNTTLGSEKVHTGLMIMTKRLDTGSPWVFHNNPRGKYFNPTPGDEHSTPNKDFLLRDVVRASTAAPHFFQPESLQVTEDLHGAFVDGGVSPYNNPALQMFMLATMDGYGLKWPFGADNILLVSVGTSFREIRFEPEEVMAMPALELAAHSIRSIIGDCDWLNQTVLQWMSQSPTAWEIDGEIGDMGNDLVGRKEAMLSYLRYTLPLNRAWIKETLNLDFDQDTLDSLFAMDQPKNVRTLGNLGASASVIQIDPEHFPARFDVEVK